VIFVAYLDRANITTRVLKQGRGRQKNQSWSDKVADWPLLALMIKGAIEEIKKAMLK
jgi:hypothetical protein